MPIAPDAFETPRLILRRLRAGDARALYESYGSDPEVAKYMVWPVAKRAEDMEGFVRDAISAFEDETSYEYVILQRESGIVIGGCGIRRASPKSDHHFIFGFCLARSAWGRGFATESVKAVVEWFNSNTQIYRLAALVDVDNQASARVLEKSGFQREGILRRWEVHPTLSMEPRDCLIFSMVR
jgi:RimJ/RimL family protein N-acetyltransferase